MIVLKPSKPRDAKKVVMKTLVRKVVFCSWLIVPAGVRSIPEIFQNRRNKRMRILRIIICFFFALINFIDNCNIFVAAYRWLEALVI